MANYQVVDADQLETDITTVADAIREKGSTSEKLEFPNGMADAVREIQSGLGVMFVSTEYDEANGRSYISNYNEIRDAWENGVLVVIRAGSHLYLPQYVATTSLMFGCVTYSGGLSADLAHVWNDGTVEFIGATLLAPTEAYIDVAQGYLYIGDYNDINFEFENVTISNKSFSVSVDETLFFELQDFLIYISTHHYVLQYYDAPNTPIVSIRGFGTLQKSESEIILKLQDYTLTINMK